jgi:DNA polymerase-1
MPTLCLIDGSSFLFRAFHALPPLTNAAGEPTGAMFGVVNMLRKLIAELKPERIAFVVDASGPTFRERLDPDYKAHRPPMPEDLRAQIEPLLAIVRAMGIPLLREAGVEADDVIGTLTRQARAEGLDVVIATSDKDLTQLVEPGVLWWNTMSGEKLDPAGVEAKFGVPPAKIVDYLALMGDASDNIPGVEKCGPKTAAKWIAEYGSLQGVIENAQQIGGKIGENLRRALPRLPLNRALVTVKTDCALSLGPSDLTPAEPDVEALRELYTRYEFKQALAELGGAKAPRSPPARAPEALLARRYELVTSSAALAQWIERLAAAPLFAFDTETTSLDAMSAELVGLSFASEPGHAAYVPLGHDYPGVPAQLGLDTVLKALRPLLEDPARAKLGQNAKYDLKVLARYGIEVQGLAHDTMLESYVWDSTATQHNLDALAKRYLGIDTVHYEDVAGKGAKQIAFSQVALDEACRYAAEDADITLRLHHHLWPKLEGTPSLKKVYQEIEVPLVPVLARMERTGVLVDARMLKRQSLELGEALRKLVAEAHALVGHPFSLDSPKQLAQVLFAERGLPLQHRTPSGQPSTNEEALEELAELDELPRKILAYRSLAKLKSTYTDKLPGLIHPETGRIHTNFHQAVAATGRLSSSDPNLQNIPIRTPEGRRIRQAFIAPKGWLVLAADYSQIELRIMAHLSADEGLLRAFRAGLDIHRATAAEVFGKPPGEVSQNERRAAKAINFGLIYGMSAFGLARQLGIGRSEAQDYVDLYFARYPGVREYMEATRKQARQRGYVETIFGRRLHLSDIGARSQAARQGAERAAINAPMQGSAADIIKRAMIELHRWLAPRGDEIRMLLQVHDELVFEVREDRLSDYRDGIVERMAGAAKLAVPLVVDVGVGANWDEAH